MCAIAGVEMAKEGLNTINYSMWASGSRLGG